MSHLNEILSAIKLVTVVDTLITLKVAFAKFDCVLCVQSSPLTLRLQFQEVAIRNCYKEYSQSGVALLNGCDNLSHFQDDS
jgi:hypothetical protein